MTCKKFLLSPSGNHSRRTPLVTELTDIAGVHHTNLVPPMFTPAMIDFTVPLSLARQSPSQPAFIYHGGLWLYQLHCPSSPYPPLGTIGRPASPDQPSWVGAEPTPTYAQPPDRSHSVPVLCATSLVFYATYLDRTFIEFSIELPFLAAPTGP
jgi:hypothetical protein